MEILNGQLASRVWIYGTGSGSRVFTYTDSQVVSEAQSGATLVMNSTGDKIFTLPEGNAGNLGLTFTFSNINTGKLTIQTAGSSSDKIADSTANGYIESATDSIAQITIKLVAANQWVIVGAHGTWTVSS